MKTKMIENGSIYSVKVLSSNGDFVTIACKGIVKRVCNPALAHQYQKELRRRNPKKKKTKIINTLPKELKALANMPKDYSVEKPNLPSVGSVQYRQDNINNCHNCMLQKSGECVGSALVCEFYRHCPQEAEYARERRLAI